MQKEEGNLAEGVQKYSDEELLSALRNLAEDLGKSPTVGDVRNLHEVMADVSTYERRFGSWNEALRRAGLEGAHDRSDETLLMQIAGLAIRLGRAPTRREVDADPTVASSGLLTGRFGKFSEAVRLAMILNDSASAGRETEMTADEVSDGQEN